MNGLAWFDAAECKKMSSSYVQIVIKQMSKRQDGAWAISPELTSGEIAPFIEALKQELDLIAVKAKAIAQ